MSNLVSKYGSTAMVAGASEGLGASFSEALAQQGFNLVLVARRIEPLELFAEKLRQQYKIKVTPIACDLAETTALSTIMRSLGDQSIDFLVYNACVSYIGAFTAADITTHLKIAEVNMITLLKFLHHFGGQMIDRKKGGIVVMASMAGLQGSGYLSTYGATKAFDRILAEGLWYEWKPKGVDIIACCAGATATPNYLNTQPKKTSLFEPAAQTPAAVVDECLKRIGTAPSYISGSSNRFASFLMQKIFSRKMAVTMMGDTTKAMYAVKD
jgi:uncharacterized protein